jgi:hypothetical protein
VPPPSYSNLPTWSSYSNSAVRPFYSESDKWSGRHPIPPEIQSIEAQAAHPSRRCGPCSRKRSPALGTLYSNKPPPSARLDRRPAEERCSCTGCSAAACALDRYCMRSVRECCCVRPRKASGGKEATQTNRTSFGTSQLSESLQKPQAGKPKAKAQTNKP